MGRLNDKERELINKLREKLEDLNLCEEVTNNANLIRWLHARNLNLKGAEEMFRKYIKWSDEIKLQSIFSVESPKAITEVGVHTIIGFDHQQCPILLVAPGKMDIAKLVKQGYKDQFLLHNVQSLERNAYLVRTLMEQRQESDSLVLISTICDMEGLTVTQFATPDVIHYWIKQTRIIENYYPETSYKIIVINAPKAFTMLWNIVKPFVSQRTIDRIEMYGKDRQQWEEALLKLAPKESLPQKYGGTLPDDVDILPKCHECVPKKRGSY